MSDSILDLELGPRLDQREMEMLVHMRRDDPLLLQLMHYLRAEAMATLGAANDCRRGGNVPAADMEAGGFAVLDQVLMKWEGMRRRPPPEETDAAPPGA